MGNKVTVKAGLPQVINFQTCTVNVGTTTTLEPEQDATVTNTGTEYNAVLNFGIPRGEQGIQGEQGVQGETGAAGADGVGISSISKTSTSGLVDTYTITMTDGNTSNFDVTNGKDGIDGQDGTDGTDGQDGFSPSATVSKTGSVTTLTVTDKNGTTTATINDGEVSQAELNSALALKQDTLVSGTNIKTVNSTSILGSGNIDIDSLPSQTGHSGKFLTTDGTDASWGSLPSQANVDLSNLSATGENHFVQLQSGVAQADVDYVVESYQNGTSWYRVYKSGWCEQGGELNASSSTTITFLKPFADTNYYIAKTYIGTYTGTWLGDYERFYDKTSTSIKTYVGAGTDVYVWEAKGYIA